MNNNQLSFCTFIPHKNNITEVKFNADITIDVDMVDQYHRWLDEQHSDDFGILVNKTNHYTYTFDAQLKLGRIDKMKIAAFLVQDRSTEIAIDSLMGIKQRRQIDYEIFYDHDHALNWLDEKLAS